MTLADLITRDRTPVLYAILHPSALARAATPVGQFDARAELLAALEAARKLGATPEPVLTDQQLFTLLYTGEESSEFWGPSPVAEELVAMGLLTVREREDIRGKLHVYSLTDAGRARVAWACGGGTR